jgi:predicted RNase H-like HicB family nuclease
MSRYVALVDGRAGAIGVVVPDLPGCSSGGGTVDEALRNAQEAVGLWADEMLAQGGKVPAPRPLEAAFADPEIAAALSEGAALALVPLVRDSGRAARANISIDAGLLDAIDEAAAARGLTRSAFLASAAREKIAKEG